MTRAAAFALAATLAAQQATFRSGTDAVTVDVSVRDGSKVIAGLRAADFELLDNGVPQDVADVSYGRLPIDVTLVLDVSFSVTGTLLERLREATRQLMRDLTAEDQLRLIDFNTRVHRAIDFTADAAQVDEAIRATAAGGGSSIFDALAVALVSSSRPSRRQLIVLFTDGADSTSITTAPALLDLARRTSASVTSVLAIPESQAGPQARKGIQILEQLGESTGGRVIEMPLGVRTATRTSSGTVTTFRAGVPDLTETFRKVLGDFRTSYVLHFTPRGVAAGGFHTLDVKVKGKRSLTIRARRGYQR